MQAGHTDVEHGGGGWRSVEEVMEQEPKPGGPGFRKAGEPDEGTRHGHRSEEDGVVSPLGARFATHSTVVEARSERQDGLEDVERMISSVEQALAIPAPANAVWSLPLDPAILELRRSRAVTLLVPLFVLSGATSLVYETLWERQLHLVMGTSQISVITVLTAFMAGLAAGGFLAGRFADKVRRPLLAYALLEGAIGVYAVAFPLLLDAIVPVYTGLYAAAGGGDPLLFAMIQFVLVGFFLLPPTICMGATLPLLARFAASTEGEAGQQIGRLYGANTIGAVCGVGMAGFYLLPTFGLSTTTVITAAGNVALCMMAAFLNLGTGRIGAQDDAAATAAETVPSDASRTDGGWAWVLPPLALLAGTATLVYEVSWFRVLGLILGGSAYAFSTMLLAFLLGIGSGGWLGGFAADRAWKRGGLPGGLALLAALQVGVGLLAYGVMWQYNELPFVFVELYEWFQSSNLDYGWLWLGKLGIAITVMLPPCLLMGATFPAMVRVASSDQALGATTGRIYGWNTLGSILGASLGGIFLLPTFHVRGTVVIAISMNFVAAGLAMWAIRRARREPPAMGIQVALGAALIALIGVVNVAKAPWNPLLMTAGMYKYVSDLSEDEFTREGVMAFAVDPYDLLFYKEGLSSVVTVAKTRGEDNIWLANNGKVDASTSVDMPTQVMVAHLPFVFADDPKDVVVIGLASGITAGSVTLQSRPSSIEIVELEPAVVEASHYFDDYNYRPLEDPRVTLIANDGRNHLFLQPDGRYDVIISEPPNPWLTGVSNLFTREFWALGKRKLKPGGVWGQWVQMYGMDHEDLRTLLRTFTETYAHVLLFSTIEDADLVLVGSDSPLELTADRIGEMMNRDAAVAKDLASVDCDSPEDVLTRYLVAQDKILQFVEGAELNTDDNMRIEYSAPRHLHEDTADDNFAKLLRGADVRDTVPLEMVKDVPGMLDLAEAYARRDDYLKALLVLKAAAELDPMSEIIFERVPVYQRRLQQQLDGDSFDDDEAALEEGTGGAPDDAQPDGAQPELEGAEADGTDATGAAPAGD
ncbi:MAG TPA: hypothetical protein DFR83_20005 [Deltaproteobacteria bacterium]|nr:hypothetical protein [Deltaproteobacteria bacterium]